jgi:hypothetical protein
MTPGFTLDSNRQPIPTAGNRNNPALAKCLAQRRNLYLEVAILHDQVTPYLSKELCLSDSFAGGRGQGQKDVECATAQAYRDAVTRQASARPVNHEGPKPELAS